MLGMLTIADIDALRERYQSIEPFPHLVIDDAFDGENLRAALSNWPAPGSKVWGAVEKGKFSYGKHGKIMPENIPETLRVYLEFGMTQPFLDFLQDVTGLEKLIADLDFGGAGLHDTGRGGFLNMHLDFNRRDLNTRPNGVRIREEQDIVYRSLNVFLYLNEGWKYEWNGHLELAGSPKGERKKIAPLFNRMVIAQCNESSWHGHPEPMKCPKDVRRRSFAWYMYTREKPADFQEKHSTKYLKK